MGFEWLLFSGISFPRRVASRRNCWLTYHYWLIVTVMNDSYRITLARDWNDAGPNDTPIVYTIDKYKKNSTCLESEKNQTPLLLRWRRPRRRLFWPNLTRSFGTALTSAKEMRRNLSTSSIDRNMPGNYGWVTECAAIIFSYHPLTKNHFLLFSNGKAEFLPTRYTYLLSPS